MCTCQNVILLEISCHGSILSEDGIEKTSHGINVCHHTLRLVVYSGGKLKLKLCML